jgi:predicted RNA-binding protein YlxR (DUF448 family)
MPQESLGQKIKITAINISAPLTRIYEVKATYITLDRTPNQIANSKSAISKKLKISSSTNNLNQDLEENPSRK